MTKILNLTQHDLTQSQKESGAVEPDSEDKQKIKDLLTFERVPTPGLLQERSDQLLEILEKYYQQDETIRHVMIGGAPYLVSLLEKKIIKSDLLVMPVYAFTQRETQEVKTDEGVEKRSVFSFKGWVHPAGAN